MSAAHERESVPPSAEAARSSRFPTAPPSSLPPPPIAPKIEEPPIERPRPATKESADSRATFEAQLYRDILGAERFRATLLAAIPTVALFALVVARGLYPEAVASILHGNVDVAPVGIFLIVVASFELYMLTWIRRLLRANARPAPLRRYVQAFVETSLPTAVVVYYAATDGAAQALLMPSAFLYFVFILLSTLRLDFLLCAFTGLVAAGEYAAVAFLWGKHDATASVALRSTQHHGSKAAILLVSGVVAGFVALRLRRAFTRAIESVGERQRILGVFGQHVSPEVAAQLVTSKAEVRSELRDVCVMFLDIRNFTRFTEEKSPEEVVDYLNTIFDSTVDAVLSRNGIVNKFTGDGFMAIFGAPIEDPAACRAGVDAALDIVARVAALVAEGKVPETRVGIGLHAGKAVVGNIGSAERKEYTVIGDVVNVASRVESLNRDLGSTVLVTDEVWRAAAEHDRDALARHELPIRGRVEPVQVWQLA